MDLKPLLLCLCLSPWLVAAGAAAPAPANAGTATQAWAQVLRAFWAQEYASTQRDLQSGPRFEPGKNPLIHDEQALILTTDRDPLGVQLRRSGALLANLAMARPASTEELTLMATQLAALATQAEAVRKAGDDQRSRELYLDLRDLTRRIMLANPLLDFESILFMGYMKPGGDFHMVDQYCGWNARPGGGIHLLHDFKGTPTVTNVLQNSVVRNGRLTGTRLQGGAFLRPDLASDGKRIAFAWNNLTDQAYHIFTVNVDGSMLTQLTDGGINCGGPALMNSSYNDFDPCWLPGGRIAFLSERRGGYLRCSAARPLMTFALHSMNPDGTDIIPISYHETNEWNPSVDNNGRLVYTRWDYVDRDDCIAHHLWTCYPDGRDPRSPHGNYPLPLSFEDPDKRDGRRARPNGEWNIRAIPGSSKYVATASGHHAHSFGELVMIDTTVPDDGAMSQVKGITVNRSDWPDAAGDYGTAWPLSEDYYLANFREDLILLDRFGNRELLYPKSLVPGPVDKLLHPMPLRPGPPPPVIPTATWQGERASADAPEATISVLDVYAGDMAMPAGTRIKWLRVIQLIPQLQPVMNQPKIGYASESLVRMPLGIVPVEADGSVHFKAPVGRELYFQLLDERGLAVRSMRSATYVHAGEKLSCVGCHESRFASPKVTSLVPIALGRSPSKITTETASGAVPFNWHLLAKPVLQEKCAACHLKAGKGPDMSHASLAKYVFHYPFWPSGYVNGEVVASGSRTVPGKFGAMASPLLKFLDESHYDVALTPDEFRRITLWLDCNGNELGAYTKVPEQTRGEIVWPEIDVDPRDPLGMQPPALATHPEPRR
ncbi:MAG: hypothetical protein NTW21_18865 [Verrucomicrobia bacterium]|nr:hypothetical protein [Verrucomicrobiota bacterium]